MKKESNSHGLARVLSKRGVCSRAEAVRWIRAGRVAVDGRVEKDPEARTRDNHPRIAIDGRMIGDKPAATYVMLNKPRGLVTSSADELGRETVFSCLEGAGLPRLVPVGRLDKASEGLLLFTNDTAWAEHVSSPLSHVGKSYHVQVKPVPDEGMLAAMRAGVDVGEGERMAVASVVVVRSGGTTAWLEVELREGKNRQIRKILEALGLETQRLIRIAIGPLVLGELAKGSWRHLAAAEVAALAGGQP